MSIGLKSNADGISGAIQVAGSDAIAFNTSGFVNATGNTPAQFDNDTSLATTAFVQRALGNFQKVVSASTNHTLTAEDAGSLVVTGGTTTTITLPAASSVPAGSSFTIEGATAGFGWTVQRAGGDNIETGVGGIVTSLSGLGGDSLVITSNGNTGWYISGGSVQLKYASAFLGSKATNGYQKLPSGLIIQWGMNGSYATSAGFTVTFPITFPTAVCSVVANTVNAGASSVAVDTMWTQRTTSQFKAYCSAASHEMNWIAIGY